MTTPDNHHVTILPTPNECHDVTGTHVDIEGERFYQIDHVDRMAPFLLSLASDSDLWLFISSTGALTAGRRDPDHALFPYYTDDRIHDSQDQTGSKTLLGVATQGGRTVVWEPFSLHQRGLFRITRRLAKNVLGDQIRFEETNHDLGLTFSYAWRLSARFGFVRRAALRNQTHTAVEIELLDGIQNLLPAGVTRRFQLEYSTLADGYKKSELDPETGLGLFLLSSIPTDKAEPSESLCATTVWSEGLAGASRLLSSVQLDRFRDRRPIHPESDVRGRRGAYFLHARLSLGAQESRLWQIVADVNQDACAVAALRQQLGSGRDLRAAVEQDLARSRGNLVRIVASADGLEKSGDEIDSWRHYSNTLNNVLRGGIPDRGHWVAREDFLRFVADGNRGLAARHRAFLCALPEHLLHKELIERLSSLADADLERLGREYLPLGFGRRHGDPSRPWNQFAIAVSDSAGRRVLGYEGNWRDIFQNWEALGQSFPGLVEAMIYKFLDCSTADGYNPYHVKRSGFDWEVIDPGDAWSFIGYWGDHQVIYLLKLLELRERFAPGALAHLLGRPSFVYAHLPYRIKPYEALLADPHHTIEFDAELDHALRQRAAALGADGKLLANASGQPERANLTEKLLVLVLAKLANYIPGGGIWMNTQRPEWNDANNALVGHGVSVVTLCYLRRFLAFCRPLFESAAADAVEPLRIAAEVAVFLERVSEALAAERDLARPGQPISGRERRRLVDALGQAASAYRAQLYTHGFSGTQTPVEPAALVAFCDLALGHIDASIACNRRDDGLYHAYNLMQLGEDGGIALGHLYDMLEGQVAVLSAGVLDLDEVVALLDSLRNSRLYRADQDSYLLYPDRTLPRFLEKNNLAAGAAEAIGLLDAMLERSDTRIVARDVTGCVHFHPALRNAAQLKQAMAALEPEVYAAQVERDGPAVLALYERTFEHRSFTGRSGTFYKYEGLGCIYWHMVSKLLVAVGEVLDQAERAVASGSGDAHLAERLAEHYRAIRAGIGAHKPPLQYGAIPTDPYSHTPSFAGVQQPGMTGQVKEDLLSRRQELGVVIERGKLGFRPGRLHIARVLAAPDTFDYVDVTGQEQRIELGPGTLAFTICQVPVVLHGIGPAGIDVSFAGGRCERIDCLELDRATSAALIERTGVVRKLDVYLGTDRP